MLAQNPEIINPLDYPDPFSPNNDTIKDQSVISFTSSKYWTIWEVKIINPLDNQSVREFSGLIEDEGKDISIVWDGRDSIGDLLAEGKYKYKIIIEADVDPPVTEIIPDKEIYVNNNTNYAPLNTSYTLKSIDYGQPVSGVDKIYYKINEAADWSIYTNAIYFTFDGKYIINFKSKDRAGNMEDPQQYIVHADGTPPDVPQDLRGNIENSTNILLFWNEVTNKDLAGYNIYDNEIKINIELITNESYYIIGEKSDNYIYQVSSVDWLGNESELSAPFIKSIDSSIAITWPDPGIYYRKMINIRILKDSEIEGPSGSKSKIIIEYGVGENPDSWNLIKEFDPLPKNRENIVSPWQLREKVNGKWEDLNGIFRIRVRLTNESGLREDSVVVWIDNEEPETSISNAIAGQNDELYLSTGELIFIQNDPVKNGIASGVKNTKYIISQDPEDPGENWITWDMQPIQLANGNYNIWYFSEDNARMGANPNQDPVGNREKENFNILIVTNTGEVSGSLVIITTGVKNDNILPKIDISPVADNQYYNHNLTINVNVTDEDLKDYYIVLKQEEKIIISQTGKANTNYTLAEISEEGNYTLTVQANDKTGNIANTRIDFGIDKTHPIVEINGVEDGNTYYNDIQPGVDIIEEHPKEIWTNLKYKQSTNERYEKIYFIGEIILTNKGNYKLDAGAADKAGNTTVRTAEFELRKFEPDEVLLFGTEYNTNADADYAKGDGNAQGGAKITKGGMGKEGEALLIKNNSKYHPARYKSVDNIDENQGSVMMWLKPLWDTTDFNGEGHGRHIFTLYKTTGKTNYSIDFVVLKEQGTTARIRYVADGIDYLHTLSVDTNSAESQMW